MTVVVLGRVRSAAYYMRPPAYREQVDAWLHANDVDPLNIPAADPDVEVHLMDAPYIVREEIVRDADGKALHDPNRPDALLRRRVVSLLRVPLPEHLNDTRMDRRG